MNFNDTNSAVVLGARESFRSSGYNATLLYSLYDLDDNGTRII